MEPSPPSANSGPFPAQLTPNPLHAGLTSQEPLPSQLYRVRWGASACLAVGTGVPFSSQNLAKAAEKGGILLEENMDCFVIC